MTSRSPSMTKRREPRVRVANRIRPHVEEAAALLKALANEQRLMILCNLLGGPMTVGELNERLDLSQSALSQHLAVLRLSDIVATARESQSIRYSLRPGIVSRLIGIVCREFCER